MLAQARGVAYRKSSITTTSSIGLPSTLETIVFSPEVMRTLAMRSTGIGHCAEEGKPLVTREQRGPGKY